MSLDLAIAMGVIVGTAVLIGYTLGREHGNRAARADVARFHARFDWRGRVVSRARRLLDALGAENEAKDHASRLHKKRHREHAERDLRLTFEQVPP